MIIDDKLGGFIVLYIVAKSQIADLSPSVVGSSPASDMVVMCL